MTLFARQQATAKRLIDKYGQAVTWRVINDAAPADPSQPWKPTGAAPTDYPVKIVFITTNRSGFETLARLLGAEIAVGNVDGLMAGLLPFDPKLKAEVIRGTETLKPQYVDTLAPDGAPILNTIRFAA